MHLYIIYTLNPDDVDVIHALFTFGSARRKKVISVSEGLIDFLVQILVNGMRADMVDPIPKIIDMGNDVWILKVDSKKAAKIRKKYLQNTEKQLKHKMNNLVGKYIFI